MGIHDNYFDLGGTSLSAIQVIARLQRQFSIPVSPIVLFEAPTVSELAKRLAPNPAKESDDTLKRIVDRRLAVQHKRDGTEIAIVGMAGRFPRANSVTEFWQNLLDGVEALTYFTDAELLEAGVPADAVSNPNYVAARPIIENADHFDAGFFGYSPRDAELMDPQHRLMMEVAWEALESAGYDSLRYDGSIGVFAGANISLYLLNLYADRDLDMFEASIGNDKDSLTTKISYKLNLKGPSLAVQTFCSTSLVSVHLACQSLRNGDSDMALAGGVALRMPTKQGYVYKVGDQDSPDGHTRSFDAQAGGTNFGDGAAMVVLKRLDAALADGDTIHAVIKGSAINNDGSLKVSYTAPSVERQAEVVALALADAGLTADAISYVEAHGTATELGDPIEVAALTRAFRASTQAKQYLRAGHREDLYRTCGSRVRRHRADQDRGIPQGRRHPARFAFPVSESQDRFCEQSLLRQHRFQAVGAKRNSASCGSDVSRRWWNQRPRHR